MWLYTLSDEIQVGFIETTQNNSNAIVKQNNTIQYYLSQKPRVENIYDVYVIDLENNTAHPLSTQPPTTINIQSVIQKVQINANIELQTYFAKIKLTKNSNSKTIVYSDNIIPLNTPFKIFQNRVLYYYAKNNYIIFTTDVYYQPLTQVIFENQKYKIVKALKQGQTYLYYAYYDIWNDPEANIIFEYNSSLQSLSGPKVLKYILQNYSYTIPFFIPLINQGYNAYVKIDFVIENQYQFELTYKHLNNYNYIITNAPPFIILKLVNYDGYYYLKVNSLINFVASETEIFVQYYSGEYDVAKNMLQNINTPPVDNVDYVSAPSANYMVVNNYNYNYILLPNSIGQKLKYYLNSGNYSFLSVHPTGNVLPIQGFYSIKIFSDNIQISIDNSFFEFNVMVELIFYDNKISVNGASYIQYQNLTLSLPNSGFVYVEKKF